MNIVLLSDIFSVERKQNENLGKWSFWSRYLGPYAVKQAIKNQCPDKTVAVIDYFLKTEDFFDYADGIIGEDTEFIGLSTTFLLNTNNRRVNDFNLWFEDHEEIVDWLMQLKLLAPKAKIFVGGHAVDAWYKRYILDPDQPELPKAMNLIDCFIHGYGESSVPNYINGKTNLFNAHWRGKTSFISDNIKAGDDRAQCLRVKWDKNDYVRQGEWLPLEISKGCRFGCKFCMFDKLGTTIKTKEELRAELIHNYENFGVTGYSLTDDTVNDSLAKMKMIYEVFTSLPFKVEWISYCRPDMFQAYPKMLDMMIESGCRGVFLGIETFNPTAAKIVGKGLDPNKIKDIVKWMKDKTGNEMFILGSFIIGLVGETKESLDDTLEYLINQKSIDKILWEVLYLRPPDYRTEAKDDFNNNKDKYGIRKLQWDPYYWEHDTLNYNQCVEISEVWKKELRKGNSGFNKALEENTNFFSYPRMRSLGYSHDESFNMLKYGNMPDELYRRNDQWIADYHKGLKNALDK